MKKSQERKLKKETGFSLKLIRQASKAGFSAEQIKTFKDKDVLQSAIGRVKPSILASAGKVADPPKPKPKPEMEEKTKKIVMELSPIRAKTMLRAQDEQMQIDLAFNRGIPVSSVVQVTIDRSYEPNSNNKYLTEITIKYMGNK